jgi:3-oxoadipate enol-lactonase
MIAHDVAGTGPVLVLLHSTVADRRMWDPQWPVLADAGFRVVRCDFRGFGETPATLGPYSDADDVLAVLGELGAGTMALAGASYGGKVALQIAARFPERVTALALICAGMPGHEPTEALRDFWQREEALLEAGDVAGATELNVATFLGAEASEATRERVRLMQRHAFDVQLAAEQEAGRTESAGEADRAGPAGEADRAGPAGEADRAGPAGEADRAGLAGDAGPAGEAGDAGLAGEAEEEQEGVELSAVAAPSLIVSGARDLPDFRQIAARLAGLLPAARWTELRWAGHLPTLERPAELSELLAAFFSETIGPERLTQ